MNQTNLEEWKRTPIRHAYDAPDPATIGKLVLADRPALVVASGGVLVDHTYLRAGIDGCLPRVYARAAVVSRVGDLAKELGATRGLLVLDAFRTTSTQASLFRKFFDEIHAVNPTWSHEAVMAETRKFVANPDEASRFSVSPHNSGGAIDLTLHARGEPCDMGTVFDETSPLSATDYFERPFEPESGYSEVAWHEIRENRRVLFHGMKRVGFVNYAPEWWHYDLGDCIWGQTHGIPWVFGSMEADVLAHESAAKRCGLTL